MTESMLAPCESLSIELKRRTRFIGQYGGKQILVELHFMGEASADKDVQEAEYPCAAAIIVMTNRMMQPRRCLEWDVG